MSDSETEDLVLGNEGKPIVDRAISLPESIRSEDGREFHPKEWHPSVVTGELIEITATFFVSMKRD